VLPAAYAYHGSLADAAAKAKTAGISSVPQISAANEAGDLITDLQKQRVALAKAIVHAESLHDDLEKQATYLTSTGADRMADVRQTADQLELTIGDDYWPLPKYREMLFPV